MYSAFVLFNLCTCLLQYVYICPIHPKHLLIELLIFLDFRTMIYSVECLLWQLISSGIIKNLIWKKIKNLPPLSLPPWLLVHFYWCFFHHFSNGIKTLWVLNQICIYKDNNDVVELSSHCIISFYPKVHNQQLYRIRFQL